MLLTCYYLARTRTQRRSGAVSEYDSQDNHIVDDSAGDRDALQASDGDSPQGGRGDPNMSGIAPPFPENLVQPDLHGFETGFHVVTRGTEVGISVYKYADFPR